MRRFFKVFIIMMVIIVFVTGCNKEIYESDTELEQEPTDKEIYNDEETSEKVEIDSEELSSEKVEIDSEELSSEKAEIDSEELSSEKNEMVNGEEETQSTVTMAFVGDMYFSDKLYANYTKNGLTGFLGQSILDIFLNTDVMIANHEYCATDLGEWAKDTEQLYNFKAPTAREFLWKEIGVDVVSLANNHIMDYGEQSLLDTMETLDSVGISAIGAGENLSDALEAEIKVVNGKKIAILAASRFILNYSWYATESKPGVMTTYESTDRYDMMKKEISRLKEEEKCDIVCVYVHFGKEKTYTLTSNQILIAHGYIDAGADLVIGSHAHNLQGIEIYKGAPIYYNLGNFLFGTYQVDTMVVNVEINADNSITTRITPCVSGQYFVAEAQGDKAREIYDFIESISVNIDIDENGNVVEKQ